ncbi:MAG: beta-propeller fold lactonase family protein [Rhodospirillaceae bacterium]|nr:beta-propeller fold lactonase family protein [Rhodospirillaceae bacterium]
MRKFVVGLLCSAALSFPAFADVAYVSNEKGGVSVIDLSTLKVVKDIELGDVTPRGIGVTKDGAFVLTANKKTDDISVIDTKTGEVVRKVHVGDGPEFLRILGDFAYVTSEPGGRRDEGKVENEDKAEEHAQIVQVDLKTWKVVKSIKTGLETEGLEFSPDGKHILATNEGDETVTVYDIASGKLVKTVSNKEHGKRPRGIYAFPDGSGYAVTLETSGGVMILDAKYDFVKLLPTKLGPNGVAFDPTGKHMLVAASRAGLLQVFDAKTFAVVKEVEIGKRCWHFTYTPDGSKILVACGRTDDLRVIDAKDFTPVASIPDKKLPWGLVTYPKAYGSLDRP